MSDKSNFSITFFLDSKFLKIVSIFMEKAKKIENQYDENASADIKIDHLDYVIFSLCASVAH